MFKGIKKRFGSNRSGRNRRLGPVGREQGNILVEPPDKGNIKPTSPRQVHPANQISPLPYSRRSLERRSRTVPTGKSAPFCPSNGAYDRRTDSFCLSSRKDPVVIYPTAPNICVTGGEIEFIHPQDSNRSSKIDSESSTLQYSSSHLQSTKMQISPIRLKNKLSSEKCPKKVEKKSPLKLGSNKINSPKKPPIASEKSRNSSPSKIPLRNENDARNANMNEMNSNSGSLKLNKNKIGCGVRRSITMPECEDSEKELDFLRNENKQVKNKLSCLEEKFLK